MSDTKNVWLSVTSSKRTAVLCGPRRPEGREPPTVMWQS